LRKEAAESIAQQKAKKIVCGFNEELKATK
jgi:hypothetical protein